MYPSPAGLLSGGLEMVETGKRQRSGGQSPEAIFQGKRGAIKRIVNGNKKINRENTRSGFR
ncbi:MAG: hypothetical protein OP8BY_0118 [Candidatus Saccharicenans subterraneus]|uniref:Uncharacterized protein n=1 Tax=Candidatus Saccharicenans subterraneus TaxID=2508984 RepID=A0A3E2BLX6_9BACT|nr:MAG: hypothetical protein OP8BY_0118 [Candidatus Saccharicenans subterraneum]